MLLLAPAAWAQTAAIAGAVSDNTGGILPGVTVTAASPALIEQQRVVVTDGQGLYTIINLQPGTYSVTFELPGFGGVVREGVELVTGFTANIDAQLSVGAIAETITVTGATPTVDVQNVRRQQVVTRELLDTLPVSTKHINNLVTLTAGFTGLADVGGRYNSQVGGSYHGKRGTQVAFDGMGVENSSGNSSYQINAAAVDEMVLQTSGIGADTKADGSVVNVIPKEGGNTFSGILSGFYANDSMESDNLSQELQDLRSNVEQNVEALGPGVEPGWAGHARQVVVLRRSAELGLLAGGHRYRLEPEHRPGGPAHRSAKVPHAAGGGTEGRELRSLDGSAGRPLQCTAGVVRLISHPGHLAGDGAKQVQRHLRRAAGLQLRVDTC